MKSTGEKAKWYERVVSLLLIPLVCWDKAARESLWRCFRFGVFEGVLAKEVEKREKRGKR